MTVLGRAARLLAGATLAWWVGIAIFAPALPMTSRVVAGLIFAVTLFRPSTGLLLVAALAPASVLLAPPPLRGAELFTWSMLAGWLLRLGHPLFSSRGPRTMTRAAALYAAALVASWLILRIGGAAGVPASSLPSFLLQAIAANASLGDTVDTLNANVERINRLLFTWMDYAAIGRRP